jgi:hypothetical protein
MCMGVNYKKKICGVGSDPLVFIWDHSQTCNNHTESFFSSVEGNPVQDICQWLGMLSCSLFTVYREAGERMGQVNQFIEQSSDSEEESYGDQDLAVINLDSWIALRWAQGYIVKIVPRTPFSLVLRKEFFDFPQRDFHAVVYM